MLNTLRTLLGEHTSTLRHYLLCSVLYGLLSGLTLCLLVPILRCLLRGELAAASLWLLTLACTMLLGWRGRLALERTGVAVAFALLREGRQRLGEHVASLPLGWFSPAHTARLGQLIGPGMMALAQLPAHVLTPLISGALAVLPVVLLLSVLSWPLGLVALGGVPLLLASLLLSARLARRSEQAYTAHFAEVSQRLLEFAQLQPVLRAFNAQGSATAQLEQALAAQQRSARRLILRSTLAVVLNGWVVQGLFAALLLAAAWQIDPGLPADQALLLLLALVLTSRYVDPLLDVINQVELLRSADGPLQAATEVLAAQPLPAPRQPQSPAHAGVSFSGVHLRYADDQAEVLRGVDLMLPPGSMTALIGASGAGKTSLMRLIARFFEATQGSVRIGDVDVRAMSSEVLAAQVSQVFQDTWLQQGSIADNILIARPNASATELHDAVQRAGVEDIIARLPDGLDTQVGEGGARLSGGERQRISIARALLKQAPILLLDEACAALDAENQALIGRTLARLRGRCTVLVIAHQLSTVALADQIVVLEHGQVVEAGPAPRLRHQGGRYAAFLAQRTAAKRWRVSTAAPESPTP
ncbi:ABC transporter ATP-binding protein [Pseudomonas cremoricolorata]|uniref:ABC transporter ATP-binding protein n=1 Tax=Pseudomonas cremoricolorata TaxID=157783 RepID=A0A089WNI6_9PSED|nr:ABC transporter ATP-binding protein [Pseudomonas cremoricolorata]AIR90875.1 ABC transporter ATP-binding protein [Pseudomonas cremoricolorata]